MLMYEHGDRTVLQELYQQQSAGFSVDLTLETVSHSEALGFAYCIVSPVQQSWDASLIYAWCQLRLNVI